MRHVNRTVRGPILPKHGCKYTHYRVLPLHQRDPHKPWQDVCCRRSLLIEYRQVRTRNSFVCSKYDFIITNHSWFVYYLYKLFLEYRGRQPFQTINLIQQEEVTLPVVLNRTQSSTFMSIRCVPVPDKPNRKDYCWIISLDELNRVLCELERAVTVCEGTKEDLIIDSESVEWTLSNRKKLTLKKAKEKVELFIT